MFGIAVCWSTGVSKEVCVLSKTSVGHRNLFKLAKVYSILGQKNVLFWKRSGFNMASADNLWQIDIRLIIIVFDRRSVVIIF